MRISESNVSMMAARSFSQKGTRAKDQKIETSFEDARRTLGFGKQAKDGFDAYSKDSYGNMSGSDIFNNYTRLGGETIGDIGAGRYEAGGFQNKVLSMLMGRFISAGMFGGTTHQLVTYEAIKVQPMSLLYNWLRNEYYQNIYHHFGHIHSNR